MEATARLRISRALLMGLAALGLTLGAWRTEPAHAQTGAARVLIVAPVDESQRVTLAGNTRPEAKAANDRGRVADSLPLQHMQLLLKRPAERESALQRYIAQLHDRASPNFHRWLRAAEFAQSFGPSQQDVAVVTAWLKQHGFVVNTVYPSNTMIDFSGTAGDVRTAFHTDIHALSIGGARHIANMSDPQIPAALAPAVAGIVSLHDLRPHAMNRPRAQYTTSSGYLAVVPADLATIYNLNPLFSAGYTGKNQTIVVIEDTDVYSTADWTTFRSTFGLSSYGSGSFSQVHPAPPSGTNNCSDPGVGSNGVDSEAILDAEWASAAAPNAAIELASCADTTTTFGGLIALQNLLNQSVSAPAIVSISSGECEAGNGAVANAAFSSTYQQAVTEGVSVFVAAGDEGAASCDYDVKYTTHGLGVSGFASTAYNVAVGGTDFGDVYAGTYGTYWNSSNSTYFGSALSYVPEIPWNDSCASVLLTNFYDNGATPYGFCNTSQGETNYLTNVAGSGGASGCSSGAPATAGVVGGSCAGTPKPAWQSGVPGIKSDGVRDLPDVSLFAGNGVWAHYYVVCWSDTAAGGVACTGAPSGWYGAGGTSFAAPILAGFQALVNQSTGSRQGNPNYVYYTLAGSQYSSGLACNSSGGNAVSAGCVFYDVTLGNMDVDCRGAVNCYLPAGTYGVQSTSNGSYAPAYATATGWDFATGIGSVNAYNLVHYWTSSDLSLSGSGTVTTGGQLSYALTVGNRGPQSAAGVVVSTVLPAGLTLVAGSSSASCKQTGQTVSCSVGTLAQGSTTALTIVVQPGTSSQTYTLRFAASSSNADLNPGDGSDAIALYWPGTATGSDGPLPLWAVIALGMGLVGVARRQLKNVA